VIGPKTSAPIFQTNDSLGEGATLLPWQGRSRLEPWTRNTSAIVSEPSAQTPRLIDCLRSGVAARASAPVAAVRVPEVANIAAEPRTKNKSAGAEVIQVNPYRGEQSPKVRAGSRGILKGSDLQRFRFDEIPHF